MRQRIIKRILVLSMVGAMAFALVACATTSSQDEPSTIDEPSQSQPTQEVETTPTPIVVVEEHDEAYCSICGAIQ